ncbi:WD40/YVTN/BNR-like repeat-containing protein [Rubricoccus marinus]|uniref:Glycosyl hydrolase n=1 Tax=Rubricoccus marinus TaxID=716817 RepID=A0A259TYY9_9BACT|nr:glycosyl hydrolase [Rubricoccus marinus]OZC02910.1 glycosyl hydrolase [Rubricoccus marinus]
MRLTLALLALLPLAATAQDNATPYPQNPIAPTPEAARMAGAEARAAMEARSPLGAVPFRSVGPTVMSGRVSAIEGKPGDPTVFYVAYASGGLWKTESAGTRFEPLFDEYASMTMGDIAVDWRDPEGDGPTVWAGTGESNSSRSSYAGTGVYKSTDGGATWAHVGLANSHHIGRIVLHPSDPNTAWVASIGPLYSNGGERGVYVTRDGGASWALTLAPEAEETGAIDLVMDPANPDRLYAATWTRSRRAWDFREAGPGSAIHRSDDGGMTWTRVTTDGSGFPTGADVGRIGLAVSPAAGGVLWATVDNQARRPKEADENEEAMDAVTQEALRSMSREAFLDLSEDALNAFLDANNFPYSYTAESILRDVREGNLEPLALVEFLEDANRALFDTPVVGAEVYRSDDGGATWTRTHEGYIDDLVYSYGYYFGQVRVAPDDPSRLYLIGVPLIGSTDGGATWAAIDDANVHVDHHDLWIDPTNPDRLLNANDGGVNISYDDARSWQSANVPAVGQFYTVTTDNAQPYNVYGGLQDNGVWRGPSDYRPSRGWLANGDYPYERLGGGDGMQIQVDPRDQTVYTGFQFGNYVRIPEGNGRASRITPSHTLGERPYRFNWQTPIHLSRHLPDVLYFGSNKVHRSLDRGETWQTISEDLTSGGEPGDVPYGTLTSLHESPLEYGLLAAGTDDGKIWVSEDDGRTWQDRSAGLPGPLWVSRVELSGHDRQRLLVSLNGYRWDHFDAYVYRSDDLGRTWTRIGTDLPAEPVNVAKEDPASGDIVYVGTDHGLYVSLDRGESFHPMRGQRAEREDADGARGESMWDSRTMPNVPVHDLTVQARDKDLVVGTHGRSIWIADLEEVQQLTPALLAEALHVFAPDTLQHSTRWGSKGGNWSDPYQPELSIAYTVAQGGPVTFSVVNTKGVELASWTHASGAGLNYAAWPMTVDRAISDEHEAGEDDELYYLMPGEYLLNVSAGSSSVSVPLVLKSGPEPRSRARKKMP